MKVYNFYASAKTFTKGDKTDSNGLRPVALLALSGRAPRSLNVISGTSAELQEITPGNCYAIQAIEYNEGDDAFDDEVTDSNGDVLESQINFTSIGVVPTVQAMEIAMASPATFSITSTSESKPKVKKAKKAKKSKKEKVTDNA